MLRRRCCSDVSGGKKGRGRWTEREGAKFGLQGAPYVVSQVVGRETLPFAELESRDLVGVTKTRKLTRPQLVATRALFSTLNVLLTCIHKSYKHGSESVRGTALVRCMQPAELFYRDWEKCVWRNVITCWNRLTNVRVARREEGRREGGGQDRSCVWMIFPQYAVSD